MSEGNMDVNEHGCLQKSSMLTKLIDLPIKVAKVVIMYPKFGKHFIAFFKKAATKAFLIC